MTKNGEKWPLNRVFRLFRKTMSSLFWKWCKVKIPMVLYEKNLVLKLWSKMPSASEILVFFEGPLSGPRQFLITESL